MLDQISLGVQTGDRIGVLGLNGSGKTTLLSLLGGLRSPDTGRVATARGTRIETVSQASDLPPGITVRDAALHTFAGAEHVWASDASVREVLTGLGLRDDRPGHRGRRAVRRGAAPRRAGRRAGHRRRPAAAGRTDQPPGHRGHRLARRAPGGPAVGAGRGDPRPLVPGRGGRADLGGRRRHRQIREGGYSDWVFARAERLRLDRAAEERRQNLARKELAWLRRGPPARTSKPRYRIEAAEALIADVPEPRNTVELATFARRRLGKDVLDLEDVSVSVSDAAGSPRALLTDVTWRLGPGDRIGVVGVNGSGKSTLLRVLVGELPPDSGTVKIGRTVRLGYLSQEVVEMPGELRLLEAVSEVAGMVNLGGKDLTAGQLAERFGFPTAQQWTRVAELSGGERRRLQLLRILMAEPNVLVLDEPTNDLDTDTLAALEDLLDGWPGTLVVVSPRPVPGRAGHRRRGGAVRRRPDHPPARRDRRVPAPPGVGAANGAAPVGVAAHPPGAARSGGDGGGVRRSRPGHRAGRCARTSSGWSASSSRCSARSPPCTNAWRRSAPTTPPPPTWMPSCAPCWPRRTPPKPTGSPSPNNSTPDPAQAARINWRFEDEVGVSCPPAPKLGVDPRRDRGGRESRRR